LFREFTLGFNLNQEKGVEDVFLKFLLHWCSLVDFSIMSSDNIQFELTDCSMIASLWQPCKAPI